MGSLLLPPPGDGRLIEELADWGRGESDGPLIFFSFLSQSGKAPVYSYILHLYATKFYRISKCNSIALQKHYINLFEIRPNKVIVRNQNCGFCVLTYAAAT